jgi:hypothetical protein
MEMNRRVDMHCVNVRIGDKVVETGEKPFDSVDGAYFVQKRSGALAHRVKIRRGMFLIDRNELFSKAEPYNGNI